MMGMRWWRRWICVYHELVIRDQNRDCHELIENREEIYLMLRENSLTSSDKNFNYQSLSRYVTSASGEENHFRHKDSICQFPWLITSANIVPYNYAAQTWLKISEHHRHFKTLKNMKVRVQDRLSHFVSVFNFHPRHSKLNGIFVFF